MLRVGEIALSKGNTIQKLIQYMDVSLQEHKVILNIQYSTTDQLGLGTTLAFPASLNTSWLYSAIQDFLLGQKLLFAIFRVNLSFDISFQPF